MDGSYSHFMNLYHDLCMRSVLNESIISVPQKTIQPFVDAYLEAWKTYKTKDIKRATRKSLPLKTIPLDLKGTKWEFLLDLVGADKNPITVDLKFYLGGGAYNALGTAGPRSQMSVFEHFNQYEIDLSLDSGLRSQIYDTLEHELAHIMQFLIRKASNASKTSMAGAPNKKILPTRRGDHFIDFRGYRYSNPEMKGFHTGHRVEHETRPDEFYTNLLSAIRSLRIAFEEIVLSNQFKIEDGQYILVDKGDPKALPALDTEKTRAAFFKQFYNECLGIEKPETFKHYKIIGHARSAFKTLMAYKKMNELAWKHAVSIFYDEFVNRTESGSNVWSGKISAAVKDVEEKKNEKSQRFDFGKEYEQLSVELGDFIFDDAAKNAGLDKGLFGGQDIKLTLEIFSILGVRETKSGFNFNLPRKQENIIKMFNKMKEMKDKNLLFNDWDSITPEQANAFYNGLFEAIKMLYCFYTSKYYGLVDARKKVNSPTYNLMQWLESVYQN